MSKEGKVIVYDLLDYQRESRLLEKIYLAIRKSTIVKLLISFVVVIAVSILRTVLK